MELPFLEDQERSSFGRGREYIRSIVLDIIRLRCLLKVQVRSMSLELNRKVRDRYVEFRGIKCATCLGYQLVYY